MLALMVRAYGVRSTAEALAEHSSHTAEVAARRDTARLVPAAAEPGSYGEETPAGLGG